MSTIKADAVTAVSAGGDLSLDGLGTGGVSIASTLKMTKGGDISSASPLVIDTDGNYFDVTGTTNFSAMTVESGNFFMLQFDGALTITHGSGIELPGAANLTTATGDRLICYATAANTVEVMSVETEAAASAGGAWTLIGTAVASASGTLDITGLSSTYDTYAIGLSDLVPATDNVAPYIRLGDSSGVDTGASDYSWCQVGMRNNSATVLGAVDAADSEIELTPVSGNIGNGAGDGLGALLYLHTPGDATGWPRLSGTTYGGDDSGPIGAFSTVGGERRAVIVVDRVQFLFSSGDVATGRMTVWGVSHA
jgi:hypothetical protein